ncbi:MAG: ComEC/Rec2 family competence protein [Phycisphaerales bacterium]
MGQGSGITIPRELVRPAPHLARRRAWSSFASVAAGGVLAGELTDTNTLAWLIGLSIAGIVVLFAPRRCTGPALLVALCLSGAWWFDLRTEDADARSPVSLIGAERRVLVEAEAMVLNTPAPPPAPRDQLARFRHADPILRFDAALSALWAGDVPVPARGRVRVSVAVGSTQWSPLVRPGDRVRVKGWYMPPQAGLNPGQSDTIRWANMEHRVGSIFCSSPALVQSIPPRPVDPAAAWIRGLSRLRERLLHAIEGTGGFAEGRSVLGALLLGEIEPALRDTRGAFRRSGTAHLLAISGFHLTVLCSLGLFLVRLSGDRGRLEAIVIAGLVLGLLILVPARVPIVRAGVLVLALLAGDTIGRRYDRLTLLGWIAIGLFVWRPMDLFSLGAQLSVGITALLIWLSSSRHPWVVPTVIRGVRRRREPVRHILFRTLRSYIVVCVLCWAVAAPVIAAHTGTLSLVGPIATAVLTPLIVLLLATGYVGLLLGLVHVAAGVWVFDRLAKLAHVTAGFVERVADVPGLCLTMPPPSPMIAGACVLILVVWLTSRRLRHTPAIAALLLVIGFQTLNALRQPSRPVEGLLRIDTLAVGDGSCHIVRSGGDAFIWDCGSLRMDLRPMLERALPVLGVRHASIGFVTHANFDHFASMPDAVDLLGVERVLVSPHVLSEPGEAERALLGLLADKRVRVEPIARGASMPFGHGRLELLWPDDEAEQFAFNDRSLVCRVSVPTQAGDRRLLLCGDIQAEAMARLLEEPSQVRADILEMPHHGSYHAEAVRFLAAVDPQVVIQSTGPSRAGDPRWADHRAVRTWYTTAEDGAVWVEIAQSGAIRAGSER